MNQMLSLLQQSKDTPEDHLIIHMAGMTTSHAQNHIVSSVHNTFSWVLDLGAAYHFCISMHLLHSLHKLSHPVILSLPNGNCATVSFIGSVHITGSLTLTDVFYVP